MKVTLTVHGVRILEAKEGKAASCVVHGMDTGNLKQILETFLPAESWGTTPIGAQVVIDVREVSVYRGRVTVFGEPESLMLPEKATKLVAAPLPGAKPISAKG